MGLLEAILAENPMDLAMEEPPIRDALLSEAALEEPPLLAVSTSMRNGTSLAFITHSVVESLATLPPGLWGPDLLVVLRGGLVGARQVDIPRAGVLARVVEWHHQSAAS